MFLSVNGWYLELYKVSDIPKQLNLCIGENPVEKEQHYKYLGMWLDVNLDWHYHIDVWGLKFQGK